MGGNTEIELKLRFKDPKLWAGITKDPLLQEITVPGSQKEETLISVYLDTPSYALKNRGIAYRIRHNDGEWVATVKAGGTSGGGLHERKEWSIVVASPQPDITVFPKNLTGFDLREITGQETLTELFKTSFKRKSLMLKLPEGGEIEFCADKGWVIAGAKVKPLREIELELKGAKSAAALKLGADLARKYPLLPEPRSKYYQGLKLAGLESWEDNNKADMGTDLLHLLEREVAGLGETGVLKEKIRREMFTPLLLETWAWCLETRE